MLLPSFIRLLESRDSDIKLTLSKLLDSAACEMMLIEKRTDN